MKTRKTKVLCTIKTSPRHRLEVFKTFGKHGGWRWRFVYQRGKFRRIMGNSGQGYSRLRDAVHGFSQLRSCRFTKIVRVKT